VCMHATEVTKDFMEDGVAHALNSLLAQAPSGVS